MAILLRHYDSTRLGTSGEATMQVVEPPRRVEAVASGALSVPFDQEWVQFQVSVASYVDFGVAPVAAGGVSFVFSAGPVYTVAVQRGHKLSVLDV